ncbi:UDP-N-acetylmuramate dehydrogenase [Aureivirga sp. CE67]|uniref:UDP-N-acetylmuramate dehydrogenase n=1 Tax=Aureivirga sp. CE67 TaxID=1788983 RepID=UPI0018CB63AB|nr:UDP-N-acetylmuramate dehydrogenase [Aureivirga sp. CE67]
MKIQQNISLKNFNTFGIDVKAKNYVSVQNLEELKEVLRLSDFSEKFILSGGSNMLLTKDVEQLVVHLNCKGKEIISKNDEVVFVKVAAGENWHDFVLWCIENDFGGIENLSLIPGNVGTCPIQNIGAYGVEVKDVITEVEAMHSKTGEIRVFTNEECTFGYRNSIFKNELKNQFIITNVIFRLSTKNHQTKISYGAIQQKLEKNKTSENPTIKNISDAVIAIRQSKLPDPKEIGNSGSFFKNPVVSREQFLKIQKDFPTMPFYEVSETETKIPAGWLIETAEYKGKRFGDAGVHTKQALVLVNYGNATGKEIFELAQKIQKIVLEKFSISLEMEVNIY